jgi:urea transport system ATP-binding protein
MSPPLFAFEDIAGGYGTAAIVRGVSGRVAAGEVLCVLGRNGVGKSTLLKLIFGHLRCW